jgi:DNA-binding NarL/FixJ family response regulator
MSQLTVTLTEAQIQLLKYLEEGLTQRDIASRLKVSHSRLRLTIYVTIGQLGCTTTTTAVAKAIRMKII